MKKYLLLFLAMGFVLVNCKKNDDPVIVSDTMDDPVEDPIDETKSRADYPVQDFMWQMMNFFYWYQTDVPNLADTKFDDFNGKDYADFLSSDENPSSFFYNICFQHQQVVGEESAVDRFSFLSDDYRVLTQGQAGIRKSNGLEYGLSLYGDDNDVFGYVRYVIKNSDASDKNIERGDIFTTVNGTSLFYNSPDDNNLNLLSENDTYTLGMADNINNTITPNGDEVTLTKQEGLFEDPIHVNKILDVGGKKVGYLMYNQFAKNSGEPLNDVFGEFKTAGVSELVLDLRYNPGGIAYITQILGSLIHRPDSEKLFFNRRFNSKYEEAADFQGGLKRNFVSDTGTNDGNGQIPLNSLDLPKIYVIATRNSASASELLINGLRPYLEVVHIGSTTVGKNQGSFLLVDSPATGFTYDPNREDEINPNNQWAIQPLTSQTENSEGFGDYSNGLVPMIEILEDIDELGELGNPTERLLARALLEIDGTSSKRDFKAQFPVDLISSSSLIRTNGGELIFNDIPSISKMKFNINFK